MDFATHVLSVLPLSTLLPLLFSHESRSFCDTTGSGRDSSPYREPCENGSKKLLFASGEDDASPNGYSGPDGSKTLLFASANSYNDICLCYYDISNKQMTCYGICNTPLTMGHLTRIFMILFPKIQFDTISLSTSCSQGQESTVGIATRNGLDGLGIESRWGTRFSTPVQTSPGAHPASYTRGAGSFPEVKRPGRGVDHLPPCSAEVKGRVELRICSPSRPS